ncbi:hypothetical protein GXW82_35315 [Streptacidiphilus sp. 4-A2]|nr:hypothetical protein [Streptacidiphilus sp. 4-A2]
MWTAATATPTSCGCGCWTPRRLRRPRLRRPRRVVLQVADRLGYTDGRFAVETAADGSGQCTAVGEEEPADVAMDAGVLGTLYLSSEIPARLHAAGLITELRPGGVARLGALLRTDVRPWCPDSF